MTAAAGFYQHPDFLPPGLRLALLACLEHAAGDAAAIQPEAGDRFTVADEVRRVWEVALPDHLHDAVVACVEAEREALAAFFGVTLEPCEAVAALRYPRGAFYRTHRDTSARRDPDGLHRRAVSVVIFVNTGGGRMTAAFSGGTLRLHEVPGTGEGICDITPVAGTLVAFRASQLHEVRPVTQGTRLSLATWLLRPDEPGSGANRPPERPRRR